MTSKTQLALQMLREDPDMTPYAAAKKAGIATSTLYVAMVREEAKKTKEHCPCCGQVVRAGFKIKETPK
ncbi:MAG: hypothetical protein IPP59_03870 [Betaproteobacteria bacterium]|jgi:hypothetical protein|nr:hypothetical protein [Candidatus Dechloromonas phosphorivorans]